MSRSKDKNVVIANNGKKYRRLVIWIEEDNIINDSNENAPKEDKVVNTDKPERLRLKDIANTEDKLRDVCKYMEENAPKCKTITELDRTVADKLFTDQWGYNKFNFVKSSSDDNIRKSMSDLAYGRGSYSDISKDYVIELNGNIINNPTDEAKMRYDKLHQPIKDPIFWYTDKDGNKINPYV